MAGTILIIDDEEGLRKMLHRLISLEGFTVFDVKDLKEARTILKHRTVDVVLCDVRLPDGNGINFIREIKNAVPLCEVVMLTAFGNIADGVQAIKNGAFDYLTKGNDNDRLIPLLLQAYAKVQNARADVIKVVSRDAQDIKDIIGESPLIVEARKLAEKSAASDITVLLLGETGTGKEVFAGKIHAWSKRSSGPFVAVNCSAFARDLLEGELFGHKAGAFTSAVKDKKGLFEMAHTGTLFLDEIGELDPDLQSKLLRVLENGEFIKIGDTRTTKVDVRVIAATNRDLQKQVTEGRFRADLYYRINVFPILLPPLRNRIEDLPLLSALFLKGLDTAVPNERIVISKEAMDLLKTYPWPGNIRELRNVLQRATILLDDHVLLPKHLPYELQKESPNAQNLTLSEVEKTHIQKVLAHTSGNKTKAAELLDIGLSTLYRKMEEYHISALK